MAPLAFTSAMLQRLLRERAQAGLPKWLLTAGLLTSNLYMLKSNIGLKRAKSLRQPPRLQSPSQPIVTELPEPNSPSPDGPEFEDTLQSQLPFVRTTNSKTSKGSADSVNDELVTELEEPDASSSLSPEEPATPVRMSDAAVLKRCSSSMTSGRMQESPSPVNALTPAAAQDDAVTEPAAVTAIAETAATIQAAASTAVIAVQHNDEGTLTDSVPLVVPRTSVKTYSSASTQTDADDLPGYIQFVINIGHVAKLRDKEPAISLPARAACSMDIATAPTLPTVDTSSTAAATTTASGSCSTAATGSHLTSEQQETTSAPARFCPAAKPATADPVPLPATTTKPAVTATAKTEAASAAVGKLAASVKAAPPPPPCVVQSASCTSSSSAAAQAVAPAAATAPARSPPPPPLTPCAARPPPPPPPPPPAAPLGAMAAAPLTVKAGATSGGMIKVQKPSDFTTCTSLSTNFKKFCAPDRSTLTSGGTTASSIGSGKNIQQNPGDAMAEAFKFINEMHRPAKEKAIEDAVKYGSKLRQLVAQITNLKTTDFNDVIALVNDINLLNRTLEDCSASMTLLGLEWPAAKLKVCHELMDCYRVPLALLKPIENITFAPRTACAEIRTTLSTKLQEPSDKLGLFHKEDYSNVIKKAKEFNLPHLPTALNTLYRRMKIAGLSMGRLFMEACITEVAIKQQDKGTDAMAQLQGCWKILENGVIFMTKVHQLGLNGFDAETHAAFQRFERAIDGVEAAIAEVKQQAADRALVKAIVLGISEAVVPNYQQAKVHPVAVAKRSKVEPAVQDYVPSWRGILKHSAGCKDLYA